MTRRHTPLDGAWRKGATAQLEGNPIESCPYEDKRQWSGKLTWSRAFRAEWVEGWKAARNDREQTLITLRYWNGL